MKRSSFALLSFCLTVGLVVALGMAILFASVTLAFAVARTLSPVIDKSSKADAAMVAAETEQAVPANVQTFGGLITDDHCGARHDMGSNKSPAECANACVHNGAKYALVAGETVYSLQGDAQELARASGLRVTLNGVLTGDTIQVTSIAANP
ncbi:MAG: hypothetical protein JOZ80_04935 [Acidobacteriaceae bacterium]|nr:hypothetical protein [Acidobacteriaceae bacterium]